MTLARQLFVGIFAAFVALLVGIEAISIRISKNYLEDQLDAHANETATALALSLGTRGASLDASVVNIMVNPLFDRGHFQSITVFSPNGARLFGRALEAREIDVPGWFTALVPLKGPEGEALITSGWTQVGKVVVQIHPGYAYRQLYDTALATLGWLAALFALALLAMRRYLAGILKPLRDIEQTALAISNRDFTSIATMPRARELQRVTLAMNSLSGKVRDAIQQESERAERLRREAFEDSLTGQLNRRGFEQAFAAMLENRSEIHSGAFALFFVTGLEEVNRVFGLAEGDAILKRLADALAAAGDHGAPIVARWQGPTLAAVVPNIDAQLALAWANEQCAAFAKGLRDAGLAEGIRLSGGVSHFSGHDISLAPIAQAAETALAQATKNKGGAVLSSGYRETSLDLKAEIQSAIDARRITLLGQQVISVVDGEVLQMELLCSLSGSDGKAIPASTFVPIASQYGLLPPLDRAVVEGALDALARIGSLPQLVSVNVSMQSIGDSGFRTALKELLQRNKRLSSRLIFEITGYAASRAPELTLEFAAEIRQQGARVALDNFDLDRNAMGIVHKLLPAYIKLSPGFTQEIGARAELRFMLEAMVRMLRPLEIPLIAQGVEDKGSTVILAQLGISGYQGYALGMPMPLPST